MKTMLIAVSAAAALGAAGCADTGPYYDPYYGGGARVALGYNAYYDDFYGPFYDGYWGPRDVYFYSTAPGVRFVPDRAHHFRREGATGFHAVQGRGTDASARVSATPPPPR